jgi:hypothetical protein
MPGGEHVANIRKLGQPDHIPAWHRSWVERHQGVAHHELARRQMHFANDVAGSSSGLQQPGRVPRPLIADDPSGTHPLDRGMPPADTRIGQSNPASGISAEKDRLAEPNDLAYRSTRLNHRDSAGAQGRNWAR